MFQPPDVMAGERARAIRAHPETAQPVVDPTDPRFGKLTEDNLASTARVDPTDPTVGELAD